MSRQMIDIKLYSDGANKDDLYIPSVDDTLLDFIIEESTLQHQRQLLLNNKGDFKENPTICVGADVFLDDDDGMQNLMREIAAQFSADGMDIQGLRMNAVGEILSSAVYR